MNQPSSAPADGAGQSDQRALHREDRQHVARQRPQRSQGGDRRALFLDHHDQRGDDVERRDRHHQDQDHEHHRLADLDGAKETGVIAGPVADVEAAADLQRQLAHHARRGQRIAQREPQTGDLIAQPVDARGVLERGQRERTVVFVHARVKQAADVEAAHGRRKSGRRDAAARRDQHHIAAHADTE